MKYFFSFQAKVIINLLLIMLLFWSPAYWWQALLGICFCNTLFWIASFFGLENDIPAIYLSCFVLIGLEYLYIFLWVLLYQQGYTYMPWAIQISLFYGSFYLLYQEYYRIGDGYYSPSRRKWRRNIIRK